MNTQETLINWNEAPKGTTHALVAAMEDVLFGWIKFEEGKHYIYNRTSMEWVPCNQRFLSMPELTLIPAPIHTGGASDMSTKLQPGDYVSTKGMDESTYRKVAQKFLEAGASTGEYLDARWLQEFDYFGFSRSGHLHHTSYLLAEYDEREIPAAQVLGDDG